MYFVYELSYQGIVFYVGSTNHPVQRAGTHLTGLDTATWRIISLIREKKELPDFKIAGIYERADLCARCEYQLIQYYANNGVALCNIEGNKAGNIINIHYKWEWRPKWRRKPTKELNTYIEDVLRQYSDGKFRHQCMDYATSVGG
jgi:hypothetical protein